MARKARVEYAGAQYHVINRGNYRSCIFETRGARESFLECLRHACESMDWRLDAWCVMENHYHLCLETLKPNLVEGMKWLQSTFANRFNRFRKTNGHVFQGRYKAIVLDGDSVGPVCHYIHLNPVRAGVVGAEALQSYSDCSFAGLWYPSRRKRYERYEAALESAGGLSDSPAGRRKYREYLKWLSEDDAEQKRLDFEHMCRGWAKGTKEFKKAVLKDERDETARSIVEAEASEMREPRWEVALSEALARLGHGEEELVASKKGEPWKVAVARHLRERCLAPHRWIAANLRMGSPSYVQSLVSRHRRKPADRDWKILIKHDKLD